MKKLISIIILRCKMKKLSDTKAAIGIFCCGVILGCCITLVTSNIMGRPCNHRGSEYDLTFARTSAGTLCWDFHGPNIHKRRVFQPTDSNYTKVCKTFEPFMAYATALSHNRGRQVIFCEKCWPYEEDIQCDTL